MVKKTTTIPTVGGVYRVPLRRVFAKKPGRVKGDATWDEIYGKIRCPRCKKPIGEGEAYKVDYVVKKGKFAPMTYHVDCEFVKPKKPKV